jgi:hypothetical protein
MNVFLVDSRTAGVLALVIFLYPASIDDPIELTGRNLRTDLFLIRPPHPLRTNAGNCNCSTKKKIPLALKLYKKFRSTMPKAASTATTMGWWIKYINNEFLPSGSSGLARAGALSASRPPLP